MVRNRYDCELSGLTDQWRESLSALDSHSRRIVAEYLKNGTYDSPESWMAESPAIQSFMRFYLLDESDIMRPSEKKRKAAVSKFEEQWGSVDIRMNEKDILQEKRKTELWPFRISR